MGWLLLTVVGEVALKRLGFRGVMVFVSPVVGSFLGRVVGWGTVVG